MTDASVAIALAPSGETAIHATMVVVGEAGVLIRGPSGAGKSRLARALIDESHGRGAFARLVADDRVRLSRANGRVIARAPTIIAGLIEERGTGILSVEHEAAAIVICLVDLAAPGPDKKIARLPEIAETRCDLGGVPIARIALGSDLTPREGASRVIALLDRR